MQHPQNTPKTKLSGHLIESIEAIIGAVGASLAMVMLYAVILYTFPATTVADESQVASVNPFFYKVNKGTDPMEKVGQGKYTKFGFSVYYASLWAPAGQYQPNKPYALELKYTRDLDKETVVDAVYDSIAEQRTADGQTLARWKQLLSQTIPAVKDGDTIVALSEPGKQSVIYLNGERRGTFPEPALSDAFFNIWLGEKANAKLKRELLGV